MTKLKVSIVTISFNRGKFLEASIRSVLEQDYSAIEYIVVDPGSTDQSLDIISKYSEKISHTILEPDTGPADGLNKGFALASGDVLAFVNAEDLLLPGAVKKIVDAFLEHPDADVIYGHGLELNARGELIQKVWSTPWSLKACAYGKSMTVQPSTFFRTSCFRRIGGFNKRNKQSWDLEFFIDLGLQGYRFHLINSFISAYRIYPGTIRFNERWSNTSGPALESENTRLFQKIMGRPLSATDGFIKFLYFLRKQFLQPLIALQKFAFKFLLRINKVSQNPPVSLVWVGGYPSHYMGAFHRRLEVEHENLFFLYVPFGRKQSAFAHEQSLLPKKFVLLNQYFSLVKVWLWLERLKPESIVISGHFPRANLVAACWAYLHNRNYYYLADSNSLDYRNLNRNLLSTLILRCFLYRANKLLYIGFRNREFYLTLLGKEHISKYAHFMPLPHLYLPFEAVPAALVNPFTFLVFGRLESVKGVDRIISAFGSLSADIQQNSRLLIAGDGPARPALQAQVAALGLVERVEFRGAVPSNRAPEVFAEANAMVIASHDEPWGLVVNEALSAGKPVIGPFWIGAFADLVIHGKTGLVTSDNSPEQLALAMQQMLNDPLAVQAMGEAGRIMIRERGWTIDGSLNSFDALLRLEKIL